MTSNAITLARPMTASTDAQNIWVGHSVFHVLNSAYRPHTAVMKNAANAAAVRMTEV